MAEFSDYPYAVTMDEVLTIAIEHLDEVRHADDLVRQAVHLKMASMALKCAMQIYADQPKQKAQTQ